MPVIRVLTQAHVRPHQQIGNGLLDRTNGRGYQTVRVVSGGALGILLALIRHAEQDHCRDAQTIDLPRFLNDEIDRQLADSGHAGHRIPYALSPDDE
jgi:hypothetical protein